MRNAPRLNPVKRRGFTLLELSVVIALIGIAAGVLLSYVATTEMLAKRTELQRKMNAINDALESYRIRHGRLPCPAIAGTAPNIATYGYEAATPGTCTGTVTLATDVVYGVVPTRTLGLPDEMLLDPWLRRFSYAVDTRITNVNAFITYPVSDTGIGSMAIYNSAATLQTSKSIMLFFSHGPNGHGAYTRSGTRYSTSNTNTYELSNCNCTWSGTAGTLDNIFYQNPSESVVQSTETTGFDDSLRFFTRTTLTAPSDFP